MIGPRFKQVSWLPRAHELDQAMRLRTLQKQQHGVLKQCRLSLKASQVNDRIQVSNSKISRTEHKGLYLSS